MDKMDQYSDLNNSEDQNENSRALELKFSLGYNTPMTGAVLNLTLGHKKEIFYPAANTGVIYNYDSCEQMLLQGHCNAITAVNSIYDAENNKRLIVTADSGKNAAIFIWNANTGAVESSIFRPETDEVISIDFSRNCYFIVFLTHQKDDKGKVIFQRIYVYEIKPKNASEQIFYTEFGCEDGEIYYELKFNPNMDKVIEFLVTSPHKIFFSVIDPNEHTHSRAYYPHPIEEGKSSKEAATFTQSIFLHNNQKGNTAITGTTGGYIIVWDICEALCKEEEIKTDRRKIKTVDLLGKYKKDKDKDKKGSCSQKDHINILVNYENYIVIGSGGGTVNFYDYNFIIVRWFENVCWMVKSISFDMGYENSKSNDKFGMADDNGNTSNFRCAPFITSDISGTITRVYDKQRDEINYTDDTLKYEEIYRGFESDITSIAVHPKLNLIAIGTRGQPPENMVKITNDRQKDSILKEKRFEYRACVQLIYYPNHMESIKKENEKREKEEENKKKLQKLLKKDDKKNSKLNPMHTDDGDDGMNDDKYTNCYKKVFPVDTFPTVLEFSPSDNLLMVGTSFQKILPLNINNLSGPLPEKQTILQIKEIADKEDKNAEIKEIIFSPDKKHFAATDNLGRIGLFRSENGIWGLVARYHFKENQIISFCFSEDGSRIFTICEDRILQEFKIESDNQIYENYLLTKIHSLKIEDDCNMTSVVWSPLTSGKDKNILISNDEYKIRSVMVQGHDQLIITKTSLGPCYGGPIKTMKILPGKDKEKRMISFITEEKIMGLMLLPIDGNPFRYMGVIAHPGTIKDMKPATNVNYIFTTGGNDYTINIWKYNINPLLDAVQQGGEGIEPFRSLLEDGHTGLRYEDMVDYFYYAQIKSKDENTTKHRTLTQTVPINLIHGLLASLGYYPSNEEILNIKNEVRYSKLNEKVDSINFDGFVKLYLNHRPYIDVDVDKIESSFSNLAKQTKYHIEADKGDNQEKIPEGCVTRESFLHMLKENGERMDDKEIGEILQVLVGDPNPNHLPPMLSFNFIFENILLMEKEEKEVKK